MSDNLPLHIKETIFSRVRYMDLFETARVSQGWWTLTMASFERFHHKKDDFLIDQVDFCNEMMPKEEPWEWWMLMEFTKSKRLFLEISDFNALVSDGKGRLIQYFTLKEIRVKHLKIDKNKSLLNNEVLRLPPNLYEIFPWLTSLEVDGFTQDNDSTIVLPLHLLSLRFGFGRMLPTVGSIGIASRKIKVLDLNGCGFRSFYLLGALQLDNLTRLSFSAYGLPPSSSTDVEGLLKRIFHDNKTLKSVTLHYAYITKEWLKIFPANVVKIELFGLHLNQDLVKVFGNNVFYERLLLFFVCEEWTSVVKFKTYKMSWEKYQEEEVDEEEAQKNDGENQNQGGGGGGNSLDIAYRVDYTCKPTANEESIFVYYSNVAINGLISKNNKGLLLTALAYFGHSYTFPIPPNVRNLKFFADWNHPNDDNFELVLENPTALEVLACQKGRMVTLPIMINLRELSFTGCNKNLLFSILCSCTSLSKLTLWSAESAVFGNIESDIRSISLKDLTIIYGNDTFEDILKHLPSLNSLIIEKHCTESILKSEVTAIKSLQYFKVIMQGNKEVAVHLSTLEFPYMVFGFYRGSHYYAASKGLKIVNEISRKTSRNNMVKARRSFVLQTRCCDVSHEEGSLVFTKNIPTRFLRDSCHLVSTVQDFIDKL